MAKYGHGAAGPAVGCGDMRALGAYLGEGEARASTELLHQGSLFGRLHDALHAVLQTYDEAGGEGPCACAGVHERGRIGDVLQAGHGTVVLLFPVGHVRLGIVEGLGLGNGLGDAAAHVRPRALDGVAIGVLEVVSLGQDNLGVIGDLRPRSRRHGVPGRSWCHFWRFGVGPGVHAATASGHWPDHPPGNGGTVGVAVVPCHGLGHLSGNGGVTDARGLQGGEKVVYQALPAPCVLVFVGAVRSGHGFLHMIPGWEIAPPLHSQD